MPARRFLVLHGIENRRPPTHWQYWLTESLRAAGEHVVYPQLPDPDSPSLTLWLEILSAELEMLGQAERVVVCHSLSCALWLAHCEQPGDSRPADRVLLVAPPAREVLTELAPPFARALPNPEAARRASGTLAVAASDNDPYNPLGALRTHAEPLGAPLRTESGAGHITPDDGYGPWPGVENWCRTGAWPEAGPESLKGAP